MRDSMHIIVLRALLRLYPRSFRERHADEVLASARAAARMPGGARPVFVLADGVLTLAQAWLHAMGQAMAGVHPRRLAGAFVRDAAFGVRGIKRRPGYSAVVVMTLAIALGANAAIYTVTHALLLERLPYASPERIVEVTPPPIRFVRVGDEFTWAVGRVLEDHPGVEAAATYYPDAGANLVAGDDASRVRITHVSGEFFGVLGARMLLGSGVGREGTTDAVLSYGLWRSAFGGDRAVLGRTIRLSGRAYRVVGVVPRGFDFPAGTQLWLSGPPVGEFFGLAFGPSVVARLRPGAFAAVGRTLVEDAGVRRADAGDAAHYITDPELIPLRAHLVQEVRLPLIVLAAAAAAVLLLGCVNVAGVSVAQVTARAPELAVRRAIGAGGPRLFGQLLAELTVMAVLAATLSVLLALAAVPLLVGLLPAGTPNLDTVQPGLWTLAFTGGATVIAALLAGVPPALAAARGAGIGAHPDRLRIDERARHRFQGVLSSVQVALAVMLVVTASLLGRSLSALQAVPLGYDTEGVLTFSVRLPEATYPDVPSMRRYARQVQERLSALPGVQVVAITDRLPLAEGFGIGGGVRRPDAPPDASVSSSHLAVSDDYFAAMGVDVLAGRSFVPGDDATRAVVLSRQLAQSLFGEASAVGATVEMRRHGENGSFTVVGVVADTRLRGYADSERAIVYFPLAESVIRSPSFIVRTTGSASGFAPAVRRVVAEVDVRVPPWQLQTTGAAAAETIAARRATAIVAVLFGAAALLLAVMAVYTMLTQSVVRRRREMGIRLALGARGRQIERDVIARGLGWTLGGIAAGVLLSLAATRLLEALLFGISPRDPLALVGTAVSVLVAAVLASWIPARRAGRVDPVVSLREG